MYISGFKTPDGGYVREVEGLEAPFDFLRTQAEGMGEGEFRNWFCELFLLGLKEDKMDSFAEAERLNLEGKRGKHTGNR